MARKKKSRSVGVSFFAFQDIITAVSGILIIIVLLLVTMIEPPGVVVTPVPKPDDLTPDVEDLQKKYEEQEKRNKELEKKRLAFLGKSPQQIEADIADMKVSLVATEEEKKALKRRAEDQKTMAGELDEKLGLNAIREQIEKDKVKVSRLENEKEKLDGEVEKLNGEKEAKANELGQAEKTVWVIPGTSTEKPLVCVVGGGEVSVTDLEKPDQRQPIPLDNFESQFQTLLGNYTPDKNYVVFWVRPSGIERYAVLRGLAEGAGFAVGHDPLAEDASVDFGSPN